MIPDLQFQKPLHPICPTLLQGTNKPFGGNMRNLGITIILSLMLSLTIAGGVSAGEQGTLSIGLKSRFATWTVAKDRYDSIGDSSTYWDPVEIEKKRASSGLVAGPEIEYAHDHFFLRGFYLQGSSDFAGSGSGDRSTHGVDMGVGKSVGAFLGYRSLQADLKGLQSANITDHSISDAVIGILLRTDPQRPGFHIGIEMVMGITGLLKSGKEDGGVDHSAIVEAEAALGYRFHSLPLRIDAGYGIWLYEDVARKYSNGNMPFSNQTVERWENASQGGMLNIVYSF
jgi:hypothetical protein